MRRSAKKSIAVRVSALLRTPTICISKGFLEVAYIRRSRRGASRPRAKFIASAIAVASGGVELAEVEVERLQVERGDVALGDPVGQGFAFEQQAAAPPGGRAVELVSAA